MGDLETSLTAVGHRVAVDQLAQPLVAPAGQIGGRGVEATYLPFALILATLLPLFPGSPALVRLISLVTPVVASYRKTSLSPLWSSATMLGEYDQNAT